MVYEIGGKYYILASRKYKEISIEKNKNDYNVIVVEKAEPIEYNKNIGAIQVSIEDAYNNINRSKNKFKVE